MARFAVETQIQGDVVRVAPTGELDLASVPVFDQAMEKVEADAPATIVIDLTDLDFLDSSGLRAIVLADERARERGSRLAVVPGPEMVRRVFEITQLDKRLELVDDAAAVSGAR